ncbi:MAG: hypothetical protein R2932_04440 [Caldilineaceae bacterium]
MSYRFTGQFHGELAPGFVEALGGVTVRLYRYRGTKYITSLSVSDPSESMKILNADAVAGKSSAALGEAVTDGEGNFTLVFEEATAYNGEAFDVDLFIADVPLRKEIQPRSGLQISLTTMKPRWETTDDGFAAAWAYTIPANFWSDIRAHFDAWTICGRVMMAQTAAPPLPGVKVTAYDADWVQDDYLGSAMTDEQGRFRIDFSRNDFLRTPLSPIINYEQGGPDLYFTVDSPTGARLLKEPKAHGQTPSRANVDHCTAVELVVDAALAPVA